MSSEKFLKDFTIQEVAEWINTIDLPAKKAIKDAIIEQELSGRALCGCDTTQDLVDIRIPKTAAKDLLAAISARQQTDQAREAVEKQKKTNRSVFTATIMIKSKPHKIEGCWEEMKIREFRLCITEQAGYKGEDINLRCPAGHLTDENATLKSYGITPSYAMIMVDLKTSGGAQKEKMRIRQMKTEDSRIKLTDKQDCITFDTCKKFLRAEMPCGHAIGCYTMFEYLKSELEKNLYSYQIRCPARVCGKQSGKECEKNCEKNCEKECGKEWNWQLVAAVADLSEDEYLQYSKIISRRYEDAQDIKECPSCHGTCSRGKSLNMIKCLGCRGPDFCWSCAKVWKGSGMQICGNDKCQILLVNDVLKTCPDKKLLNTVTTIPEIRACPSCLTLIFHKENCKHMKCGGCGKSFCFSCLHVREDNGNQWTCGGAYEQCKIADRQILK